MKVEKPKPNTFLMRGLQWTTIIERTFYAESPEQREAWLDAIRRVSDSLKPSNADEDMMDVSNVPMADSLSSYGNGMQSNSQKTVAEAGAQQMHEETNSNNMASNHHNKTQQMSVITLEHFEFLKVLGKGTFGKVILVREKRTDRLYAIKILKKEVIVAKEEIEHTRTENRVLQKCKHPFLTVSFSDNQKK